MNCERARELIIDALVEPLDAELAAELGDHVSDCGGCAAEAAAYEVLWLELATVAVPQPLPNGAERLRARVREELGKGYGPRRWSWRRLLLRAATVLLLVGLGAAVPLGFDLLRQPSRPSLAEGDRYLLILTHTTEPTEQSQEVENEMAAWTDSLAERGVLESMVGLTDGPPVGTPPDGPLMEEGIAGFMIVRAAGTAEARRIAVSSPSIRYGGFVEIRSLD